MGWADFPIAPSAPDAAPAPTGAWQNYPPAPPDTAEAVKAAPKPNAPGLFDPDQVARNVTFGLSDKAAALGSAVGAVLPGSAHPGGFWDAYSNRLSQLRQGAQDYGEAHPIASVIGPIAGSLATAPAAAISAAPSLLGAMGQGAKAGAAVGAAQGFGQADEHPIRDTLAGAAGGAAFGAAVPPALQLLRPMAEGLQRLMPSAFPQATQGQATARIAERINQDAAAGGPGPAEMMAQLAGAPGKPQGLVDVGGENIKGMAGQLARTPGASREMASNFFSTRDADAGARLIGDIDQSISSGSNAHEAIGALMQQRATAAAPLYQKAFAAPTATSPRLDQFLKDPDVQRGLQNGLEIQRREALAAGQPIPQPPPPGGPDLRTLDMAKAGLDDMVEQYRDPTSGRLQLDRAGRALNDVRHSFVGELDQLYPDYAAARQAWSGPSTSADAIQRGQSFQSMRPEEIQQQISRMSAGDRDFFLLGVADKLRSDVLKTAINGDEAKRLVNNQYVQNQLRPLFGSDAAYQKFIDSVSAERRMFETKGQVVGNSATAARMAEDVGHGGGGPLANLAAGAAGIMAHEPFAALPLLMRGGKAAYSAATQPNAALREEMARRLFDPNHQANTLFLQQLANRPPPSTIAPYLIAPGAKAAGTALPAWLNAGSVP